MAQGRRTELRIELTPAARRQLESYQRSTTVAAGLARRARLVLLLADGTPVSHVARLVGMQRRHVYKWADRFSRLQMAGLEELPRGGSRRQEASVGPIPAPIGGRTQLAAG